MTLNDLYRDMRTALEGAVDVETLDQLTNGAALFAGTVGWAEDVIDKDGRIIEAFDALREKALARFKEAGEPNIATLHDALADLILAVRTHDEDLDPLSDSEIHDG